MKTQKRTIDTQINLINKQLKDEIFYSTVTPKSVVFPSITEITPHNKSSNINNETLSRLSTTYNANQNSTLLSLDYSKKRTHKSRQVIDLRNQMNTFHSLHNKYNTINPFFSFESANLRTKTLSSITTKKPFTFIKKPTLLRKSKEYLQNLLEKKSLTTALAQKKTRRKTKYYSEKLNEKTKQVLCKKVIIKGEDKDRINVTDIEYDKIHKTIRQTLLHDINPMTILLQKADTFFTKKENVINFVYDIFCYPHLQNTFMLRKSTENNKKNLISPNCLSKSIQISMNKERRKNIFIKDYQSKQKKDISLYLGNDFKSKFEDEDDNENYIDKSKYDIEDFFNKSELYKNVFFANQKERQYCKKVTSLSIKK